MDRRSDYVFPSTWRGVASPRYMRLARWLSLVEELGGMQEPRSQGLGTLGGVLTTQGCQAGSMDMTLTTTSQQAEEMAELRDFMTAELTRHERLVLLLFYADGLKLPEIAEVLDLPVATVVELFERTLATLQKRFG